MELEMDTVLAWMRIVGVGGGGGNAVRRMLSEGLVGVDLAMANTDAQALAVGQGIRRVQLGTRLTRGLGAGASAEIGRKALEESQDEVVEVVRDADLVLITAGLGGGTGTGAAPGIARLARQHGALAVAVVTMPFAFEGKKRMRQAEEGLRRLRAEADAVITIPNERLRAAVPKGTPLGEAFRTADQVVVDAVRGITDLVRLPGEINVDFADVRTVLQHRGLARMGEASGTGPMRAVVAANGALHSPLLEGSISGAAAVLVNVSGGEDMTLDEVSVIAHMVQEEAGDGADIILGTTVREGGPGEVRVTVIATGFEEADRTPTSPSADLVDQAWARPKNAPATELPGTRTVRPTAEDEDLDVPTYQRRPPAP